MDAKINETGSLRLLRRRPFLEVLGIGPTTAATQEKEGLLPPGVKIGKALLAWPAHEADMLVRARIAGKTDAELKALVQDLLAKRKTLAA